MLTVSRELLSVFSKDPLEHDWSDDCVILVPHFVQQLCIGLHQSTLSAKRVIRVEIIFEAFIQEVLGEFPGVAEALQTAVHVTGVPQIRQTHLAVLGRGRPLEGAGLQLCIGLSAALVQVPPLVLLEALGVAVAHSLALALDAQNLFLGAELALAHKHSLVLQKGENEGVCLFSPKSHLCYQLTLI